MIAIWSASFSIAPLPSKSAMLASALFLPARLNCASSVTCAFSARDIALRPLVKSPMRSCRSTRPLPPGSFMSPR